MSRRLTLGALVAALGILLVVVPARAAAPLAVHIEAPSQIATDPDPFTASGPAVDAGVICPEGQVTDQSIIVTSPPGGTFRILRVLKRFDCDDGSGTFDVRLVVNLDLTTNNTTANWQVVGGTGDYAGLHGNGKLVGTAIVPGESILDVYEGKVH